MSQCRIIRILILTFVSVFSIQRSSWSEDAAPDEELIERAAEWRYLPGPNELPDRWSSLEFDDSEWKTGKAGFGYGDGDDRTVLRDMEGNYTILLIRRTFNVADPSVLKKLFLYVNYDDAFIAYINGKQVAAGAAVRNPKTGAVRIQVHEAIGLEEFAIDDASDILKAGNNVLAIAGYNAGKESSDFSLDPVLRTAPRRHIDGETGLRFTASEYRQDLAEFRERLLDQSSYLTLRGFDYETAIQELHDSISDETMPYEFIRGLQKIIAKIGDCHAGVRPAAPPTASGYLPFRIADTRDGLAAIKLNADEPYDADHPYLDSLDGRPMRDWLDAAGEYVAYGSPQLRHRRAIRQLAQFDLLRNDLGVPRTQDVSIGLQSNNGSAKIILRGRLSRLTWGAMEVQQLPTRLLDGNIGYLRIPQMDNRSIDGIVDEIFDFRDSRGLIIDVRDNPGGRYGVLRRIYPFFVPPDAPPRVTNIAAFRLSDHFQPNHIAYRPTYRASWNGWDEAELAAIDDAMKKFKPNWVPPKDKFSEWHFMLLSRKRSGQRRGFLRPLVRRNYFYYDRPVVVLCNAGSFSATDGFVNAFAAIPTVQVIGEPTGGGSGATRRFKLPNTGATVALSSMASFRPNGKTFDGNGVEVDISLKPSLADFISDSDSVLDRAVQEINKRAKE